MSTIRSKGETMKNKVNVLEILKTIGKPVDFRVMQSEYLAKVHNMTHPPRQDRSPKLNLTIFNKKTKKPQTKTLNVVAMYADGKVKTSSGDVYSASLGSTGNFFCKEYN